MPTYCPFSNKQCQTNCAFYFDRDYKKFNTDCLIVILMRSHYDKIINIESDLTKVKSEISDIKQTTAHKQN